MRYFLRHGVGMVCSSRRTIREVVRQAVAALLIAAMPATTLPVDAASMGPVRQARAPQSVPSFYLPPLASNQDYVSERMSDPNSQVDKSSSLRASASALPGASRATLHLAHPMANAAGDHERRGHPDPRVRIEQRRRIVYGTVWL